MHRILTLSQYHNILIMVIKYMEIIEEVRDNIVKITMDQADLVVVLVDVLFVFTTQLK